MMRLCDNGDAGSDGCGMGQSRSNQVGVGHVDVEAGDIGDVGRETRDETGLSGSNQVVQGHVEVVRHWGRKTRDGTGLSRLNQVVEGHVGGVRHWGRGTRDETVRRRGSRGRIRWERDMG